MDMFTIEKLPSRSKKHLNSPVANTVTPFYYSQYAIPFFRRSRVSKKQVMQEQEVMQTKADERFARRFAAIVEKHDKNLYSE